MFCAIFLPFKDIKTKEYVLMFNCKYRYTCVKCTITTNINCLEFSQVLQNVHMPKTPLEILKSNGIYEACIGCSSLATVS